VCARQDNWSNTHSYWLPPHLIMFFFHRGTQMFNSPPRCHASVYKTLTCRHAAPLCNQFYRFCVPKSLVNPSMFHHNLFLFSLYLPPKTLSILSYPYNPPDGPPPHPLPLWAKHLSPGLQIRLGTESFRSGSTRMTHCQKTLNISDSLVALPAL
jgi:hypothetical protein